MDDIDTDNLIGHCEGCSFPIYSESEFGKTTDGYLFCEECCEASGDYCDRCGRILDNEPEFGGCVCAYLEEYDNSL